jgi:DNA polymerase-3 subunit delta'
MADFPPTLAGCFRVCGRSGLIVGIFSVRTLSAVPVKRNKQNSSFISRVGWLGLYASGQRDLNAIARTVDHPYNPTLIESLVSRAKTALLPKRQRRSS